MKNKQINSLKGILMMMIVFYHYTFRFQEVYQIKMINFFSLEFWGNIGVAGFFIISGYFMLKRNDKNFNIKQFLIKRISRLYPAYFFSVTLIFISVTLFRITRKRNKYYRLFIKYYND